MVIEATKNSIHKDRVHKLTGVSNTSRYVTDRLHKEEKTNIEVDDREINSQNERTKVV